MSGSKQKTTSNQTSTPTNPSWVTGALQGYTGQVQNWANNTNAQDLVAPASQLQNQAFTQAQGLGANSGANYGQATGAVQGVLSGDGTDVSAYMNPYQQQVIDATLADYDANSGRVRAQQAAQGAGNKAFGGSRYGVQEAMTEGELGRGRATTQAGLLNQGYQNAQAAYDANAQRQLAGAGLLGSLSSSQDADQRANLGLLAGLGEQQRGIDADYRTADLSMLQALGALNAQGQYGLFQGQNQTGTQTTSQNPGLLGSVGQGAQAVGALAGLFSDGRLKKNIETVRHDERGRRWASYNYIWEADEAPKHEGVIAQEILSSDPEAVRTHESGFLVVDYGALQ